MQIKAFVSDSRLMGRYSKYELYKETIEEKDIEEITADLEKAIEENNKYYRSPFRWREMDPRYFIVPAKDATFQEPSKSPFDFYPQILLDFIEMARRIEEDENAYRNNEESAKRILKFCNRYGLLNISGLYSVAFGTSEEVDHDGDSYFAYKYEWVLLSQKGLESIWTADEATAIRSTHDFVDHFIPEKWSGADDILKDKDNLHIELMNNYHTEPVYYAKKEILELYWRFKRWFDYIDQKEDPWVVKEELSAYLISNPVEVSVDYNGSWRLKWIYKNLIDALNIMFLHNIIEQKQKILFCENEYCKAPFIVRKDTQIYCSPNCRDAARYRRWYDEHKKKNREN